MKRFDFRKWSPLIIASAAALAILGYYVMSGQGSLDKNARDLVVTPNLENIDYSEAKRIEIKCKNGQSYQIVFKQQHQNYDDLIFNTCGPDGAEESENST